jgi:carbonic anhydrase
MAQGSRSSGRGTIVLSCSDPRLNPYQIFGVDPSLKGITMVRNAGGRAVDAIRTISVLQTIGRAKTVVVMHHTGKLISSYFNA